MRGEQVLLVRRRDPPNPGQWALPGGSVRLGETLREAAEREVLEETGVRVRAGRPVFAFDVVERDGAGAVLYHYVVVDLLAEHLAGEPRPSDDALEAGWFSPADARSAPVNATTLTLLREVAGGNWRAAARSGGHESQDQGHDTDHR
jgi:ADP-ribose pyrophosphatase